jgi:protein required for attachment to host cells
MIWVINYNAVDCHVYIYDKSIPKLNLVQELKDPRNRTKNDPKEVEIDHFAREIAAVLEKGRNDHAYNELLVIGPPHMNGMLFKHMNKFVKEMVKGEFQKDFQNINAKDLLEFIQKEEKKSADKIDHEEKQNNGEI